MNSHAPARPIAAAQRNSYIDLLRALAIGRVLLLHALFISWITFVLPSMGLMFALGGSLMAASLERRGSGAIFNRLRRILPSLWMFGIVLVPLMLMLGWRNETGGLHPFSWHSLINWVAPVLDPPGSNGLDEAWKVLWYLRAYSWLIVLSPLLLWAFRRRPWVTILAPLALLVAIPNNRLADNGHLLAGVLDLGTYGTCWMLGMAHHTGLLARIPLRRYVGLIGLTFLAALCALLPHLSDVELQITNHALANALWSSVFVLILLRLRPSMAWLENRRRLVGFVRLVNRRALTIYLWHVPSILLAGWTLQSFSSFNPERLEQMTFLQGVALMSIVLVYVSIAVLLFGWVERIAGKRQSVNLGGMIERLRITRIGDRLHEPAQAEGDDRILRAG